MFLFWEKKTPRITRDESLDAVVVRNRAVQARENEGGGITLIVPFRASALVRRLSGYLGAADRGERKIELDEVGSFVWRMCDGQSRVREMIARLAEKYKLNRKEAEVSLTTFLRTLAARRLVVIAVLKGKKSPREKT